jgi:hypothetical protein
LFLNPLLAMKAAKKENQSDDEEWSDDDKYEPKLTKEQVKEKKDKERKLLGKRAKSGL